MLICGLWKSTGAMAGGMKSFRYIELDLHAVMWVGASKAKAGGGNVIQIKYKYTDFCGLFSTA